MIGNIIVAHGMRKGQQNKALESFVGDMLKNEAYHYEMAFLESDSQSLEQVMTRMIEEGINQFRIIPLLIFSAMHYISDIPNILNNMTQQFPHISAQVSRPLGTHQLMTLLVEQRINDAINDEDLDVAVVIVAHGNGSGQFTKAHDELQDFVKTLTINKATYARTLYGALSFKNDLEDIANQYDKLIVVPLFLYDGRLVNKVKQQMLEMNVNSEIYFTPSINFDPILNDIINDQLELMTV